MTDILEYIFWVHYTAVLPRALQKQFSRQPCAVYICVILHFSFTRCLPEKTLRIPFWFIGEWSSLIISKIYGSLLLSISWKNSTAFWPQSPVIFPSIIFLLFPHHVGYLVLEKWDVKRVVVLMVDLGIMMLMSATRTPFFERYSCHNMATVRQERDPNPPPLAQQTWHQV